MAINSLSISDALFDVPFQEFLNDFEEMKDSSGIPTVATMAEYFVLQSTSANIGVYDINTALSSAQYAANQSSFTGTTLPVTKKSLITQINLKSFLTSNLGQYRTPQGGYSSEAVMALCNFVGSALSNKYLETVMSNLQANLVAQLTPYPTHYVEGLSGKIDWTLTDPVAPVGKTKIIDYVNAFYALMPPEMKWAGKLANILTAYVSQNDFETMKISLANAYQFNPTGGFEQGKDVFTHGGQLTLEQVQIMNANSRNCHILLGNIAFRPMINMQDDTMILTYQKIENKNMYYEKIPHSNKQNLYFGIQGDFAYQPKLLEPIYKITDTPYSLPLTAGRMFLSNPDPYNPMEHNLNFYMGTAMILQDASRAFCLFPN